MENMCMYKISSAPYLAVSHVHRGNEDTCLVKDTHGRLKRVKPLYIGPFDVDKLCKFGAIVSNYFQPASKTNDSNVVSELCKIFDVNPTLVLQ